MKAKLDLARAEAEGAKAALETGTRTQMQTTLQAALQSDDKVRRCRGEGGGEGGRGEEGMSMMRPTSQPLKRGKEVVGRLGKGTPRGVYKQDISIRDN